MDRFANYTEVAGHPVFGDLMVNRELLDEIRTMTQEGKIAQEEAMRLLLRTNVAILEKLSDYESRIERLEDVQADHPSLTWLWENKPKKAIQITLVYFAIGMVTFAPIIFSDIRQPIINQIVEVLRGALIP